MKYMTMTPEQLRAVAAIGNTVEGKIFLTMLKEGELRQLGSSVCENEVRCRWCQGGAMELAELIIAFEKSQEELNRRDALAVSGGG